MTRLVLDSELREKFATWQSHWSFAMSRAGYSPT